MGNRVQGVYREADEHSEKSVHQSWLKAASTFVQSQFTVGTHPKCSLSVVCRAKPESLHNLKRAIRSAKYHLSEFITCSDDSKDNRNVHTQEEFHFELGWGGDKIPREGVFTPRDQGLVGQHSCWQLPVQCKMNFSG